MKYLISVLRNGKSSTVGFVQADSVEAAAEKLDLRPSAAAPNGFVFRVGKGKLFDIRLEELSGPEIFGSVGIGMAIDKL